MGGDFTYEHGDAIEIDYEDLIDAAKLPSLFPQLQKAFGDDPECLGIVIISNLPSHFPEMRRRALLQSSRLARLPASQLREIESEASSYLVGWSRGREMFMGRPDTNKGSFYVNPTHDYPASYHEKTSFPEYETANLWPPIPEFKESIEELGKFIVEVGQCVARACDSYVKTKVPRYKANYLEEMVASSKTCKARLLHYFPTTNQFVPGDAWCGEHLDHGCLTGLTSAMFIDESKGEGGSDEAGIDIASPDPESGLYIKSRAGKTVKIAIPKTSLAFQTGQALQITTDGVLKAVPHFVKGSQVPQIARNSKSRTMIENLFTRTNVTSIALAVFMQPNLQDTLGNRELTFAQFARGVVDENYGVER